MMATYSTKQEPLVTCPFNPAHRVKSGRYQIHITKCKKSHPGVDIKHCPFSADHVVEPSQLMHHVFTCPLNTSVKRYHSKPDDSITGPMVPTRKAALGIKSEENWEEEANEPQTSKGKVRQPSVEPIFPSVMAMTPVQKRLFYASLHKEPKKPTTSDAKPSTAHPQKAAKNPDTAASGGPPMTVPEQPEPQGACAPPEPAVLQGEMFTCCSEGSKDEDDEHGACYTDEHYGDWDLVMSPVVVECDDEVERAVQARMKLLGIGRGRRLN